MKTFRAIAASLLLPAILLGCSTTDSGRRDITQEVAESLAPAIRAAANLATQTLVKHEPNAGPYIRLALPVIRSLDSRSLDKQTILKALQESSVRELKNEDALALADPILDILESARAAAGISLIQDRDGWRRVVEAFLDGVEAGANAR